MQGEAPTDCWHFNSASRMPAEEYRKERPTIQRVGSHGSDAACGSSPLCVAPLRRSVESPTGIKVIRSRHSGLSCTLFPFDILGLQVELTLYTSSILPPNPLHDRYVDTQNQTSTACLQAKIHSLLVNFRMRPAPSSRSTLNLQTRPWLNTHLPTRECVSKFSRRKAAFHTHQV